MKIKQTLIALSAFVVLMASCSKDPDNGQPIGPDEDTKATVKVVINTEDFGSKAASFPGNEATAYEKKIYNYAVLVFNSSRMLEHIEVASPYRLSNPTPDDYTGNIEVNEFEVSLGNKFFYVIMNVPVGDLLNEQNNMNPEENVILEGIQDYVLDMTSLDLIVSRLASGNSATSNSNNRGFMMTSLGGLIPKNISNPEENNVVNLTVGRAMAKVSLSSALEDTDRSQPRGILSNIKYKVGNNPNSMYVIQHLDGNPEVVITPNYYHTHVQADAYMGPLEGYQAASVSGTPTFTYCMENANKVPREGNSAVTYIEGKFTPRTEYLLDADGNAQDGSISLPSDGTFWRIRNTSTLVYNAGYYVEQPATVPTGFEAIEYPGGICYYTLWLKNPSNTVSDPYTVRRNSYYKVALTVVQDAGESDEDGLIPDPDKKLEEQGIVEGNITIVNWDEINQEGIL